MLCSLSLNGVGVPYYITENNDSEIVVPESRASKGKEVIVSNLTISSFFVNFIYNILPKAV